jgi:hypothetical protein
MIFMTRGEIYKTRKRFNNNKYILYLNIDKENKQSKINHKYMYLIIKGTKNK